MPGSPAIPLGPEPDLKSPTVLVVEDEILVSITIADYLRDCGFGVIEARDAAEALSVISNGSFKIDIVFTDVNLPGEMNGFGLAKWIRANKPDTRVLITSGAQKAEDAGDLCDDGPLLKKPYEYKEVERRMRTLLAARDQSKK